MLHTQLVQGGLHVLVGRHQHILMSIELLMEAELSRTCASCPTGRSATMGMSNSFRVSAGPTPLSCMPATP